MTRTALLRGQLVWVLALLCLAAVIQNASAETLSRAAPNALPEALPVTLPQAPQLGLRRYILYEASSAQPLAGHDTQSRLTPRELILPLYAYVVFSKLKSNVLQLDTPVPLSREALQSGGTLAQNYKPGEKVTVGLLLTPALKGQADARYALAEHLGGDVASFIKLLNDSADFLGLGNTHLSELSGEGESYSTVADLGRLAVVLTNAHPGYFERYFKADDQGLPHFILSHSREGSLLGFRQNRRRLLAVVIGDEPQQRLQAGKKLLRWGEQAWRQITPFRAGEVLDTLRVWKGSANTLRVGLAQDFSFVIPQTGLYNLDYRYTPPPLNVAPMRLEEVVGVLRVYLNEQILTSIPLAALDPVPLANPLLRWVDTWRLRWFPPKALLERNLSSDTRAN